MFFYPSVHICFFNCRVTVSAPLSSPHLFSYPALSFTWQLGKINQYVSTCSKHIFLRCLLSETVCSMRYFFVSVHTAGAGEESRHSCIIEAFPWRCEDVKDHKPGRMRDFAAAETGEQCWELPAHIHTPAAECKKQPQWLTACKCYWNLFFVVVCLYWCF